MAEQKRQQGKKVLYGQIIQVKQFPGQKHDIDILALTPCCFSQLRHVFTDKFVHVSATQTSRTETSNMQVNLINFMDLNEEIQPIEDGFLDDS